MLKKLFLTIILSLLFLMGNPMEALASFGTPVANNGISTYFTPGIHNGIDYMADYGTPVYASSQGTISFAGWDVTGYGNRLDIADGDDIQLYGHLSYINKWSGWVNEGEYIGNVGSSGWSTGPHLHFEISWRGVPVNPLNSITY